MIENSSSFPDSEVWKLVTFSLSASGVNDAYVRVADYYGGSYLGVAYDRIPDREKEWQKYFGFHYYIYVGINQEIRYPISNVTIRGQWRDAVRGEDLSGRMIRTNNRKLEVKEEYEVIYGGEGSPRIVCHDWKEVLVSVTAHEARHVVDYREGTATNEASSERHALTLLEAYRRFYGGQTDS
jgi:hypothetical protein